MISSQAAQPSAEKFDVERAAHKGRIMREVAVQNGQPYAAMSKQATDLARALRSQTTEGDAIEWGRALLAAGSMLAALHVSIRDEIAPRDQAALLLNLLGWAGLDLLDGNR